MTHTALARCVLLPLSLAGTPAAAHVEAAQFAGDAFVAPAEIVDCTLVNGDESQCLRVTLSERPDSLQIGPFCPETTDEAGGIWYWSGDNAGLYRLDQGFWALLKTLGYDFTDGSGGINQGSPTGARPEADHACISATETDDVRITALIPVEPIKAEAATTLGTVNKVGIALDGVPIFSDAPTVAMTGHLPALDLCGGHVDPGGWFHWHATATDIDTVYEAQGVDAACTARVQSAGALFAYAFDGYPIYGSAEPDGGQVTGLDACNGHDSEDLGYHYHASDEFPNLPPCLTGVVAEDNFSTTAAAGIGAVNPDGSDGQGAGPARGPDLAAAASILGVSEQALAGAIKDAGGPPPDLEAVATLLDLSIEDVRDALAPPTNR
ncbi:YHYH protein [Jannaschia sp. 2305UL9-9]|uniref:YHYH protein n=1 Tax=Jannaschia sp. 2305UL9-9 TaxID=3121638 RepID=UPI0035281370